MHADIEPFLQPTDARLSSQDLQSMVSFLKQVVQYELPPKASSPAPVNNQPAALSSELLRVLFCSAARLWWACPWQRLAPGTLLGISVPGCELFSYIQFVGGEDIHSGKGNSWCAMNCYRNCADIQAQQAGGLPMGPVLQLAFDHCTNVSAEDIDLMQALQLPIACEQAFPQVASVCYRAYSHVLAGPTACTVP
jgi:hypothetical protein